MQAKEFIDGLSAEQKNAATYTKDPVMVLAGAGSGKTRTLIGRFIHLVSSKEAGGLGADPSSVMMVTFTNKAAREMRERIAEPLQGLREAGQASPFGEPWIGTFHGLSLRILRIEADKAGLGKNFSIYDESDAKSLLNEVTDEMGLTSFDADDFFKDLETAKARVLSPEFLQRGQARLDKACAAVEAVAEQFQIEDFDIEAFVDGRGLYHQGETPDGFRQACDEALAQAAPDAGRWVKILDHFKSEGFVDIYGKYQAALTEQNAVDFNDLLNRTTKLFQENPEVRDSWRSSFRHFMVDEVQDMNRAQVQWLMALTGGGEIMEVPEGANTTEHGDASAGNHEINTYRLRFFPKPTIAFVGDDDQSIYGFRGSESAVLRGLSDRFDNLQTRYLLTSYRCQPSILEAANALVRHNTTRFGKDLFSYEGATRGAPVRFRARYNPMEEIEDLAKEAKAYLAGGGEPSEFAILVRTRDIAKNVAKDLRAMGLPVVEGRSSDIRKTAEVKDAMSFVAAMVNPDAEAQIMRIINKPARGLGPTSIRKVRGNARIKEVPVIDELRSIMDGRIEVPAGGEGYPDRFKQSVKQFGVLLKQAGAAADKAENAGKAIEAILREVGYLPDLYQSALRSSGLVEKAGDAVKLPPRDFLGWLIKESSDSKKELDKDMDGEELADRAGQLSEVARRIGNLSLLMTEAAEFEKLADFAQESTLEMGQASAPAAGIQIMTMHGAKGLEYDHVRIPFCLEGIIPHGRAVESGDEEIEEERRLFYVTLTRGKKSVGVTRPMNIGKCPFIRVRGAEQSRFVDEMSSKGADVQFMRMRMDKAPVFLFEQAGSRKPFETRPDDPSDVVVNTYPYGPQSNDGVPEPYYDAGGGDAIPEDPGGEHIPDSAYEQDAMTYAEHPDYGDEGFPDPFMQQDERENRDVEPNHNDIYEPNDVFDPEIPF